MTKWRSIDSAPKDGTRILVGRFHTGCRKHGRVAVDYWHNAKDHGYSGFGRFNQTHWPATHWLPLPPPPKEEPQP